jgi:DNA repair protein RadC
MTVSKYRTLLVKESTFKVLEDVTVTDPDAVYKIATTYLHMDMEPSEVFVVMAFDIKSSLTGISTVGIGNLNSACAEPREVFRFLIAINAASYIVCHNHTSGNPDPSDKDIEATKRLIKAGRVMGIHATDHVIIGQDGKYVSMRVRKLVEF